MAKADIIGIIGGSGIYDPKLLKNTKRKKVSTPFGKPSDAVTIGTIEGKKVAFLPRHGPKHELNPSNVNYRANVWALKKLGCSHIISPCAVGSLQDDIEPGTIVFVDQFIDFTKKRLTTFYDKPGKVCHISVAEPMCNDLREILIDEAKSQRITMRDSGTYVCIEGPRFSTKAESQFYRGLGGHVIGMTLCPEASLAREAELCYSSIAMVTDYDTFKEGHTVTTEAVLKTMKENVEKVRSLLMSAIPKIPETRTCSCKDALKGAFI